MNSRLQARRKARARAGDRGFTLVELVIAVVLSAMIGGVVVMALVTSLNVASSATAQVGDSTDAGLISSFLVRDAQSAGGIDPATALVDHTLGVSTDPNDPAGIACAPLPAALAPLPPWAVAVRLSWADRSVSPANNVVVTYAKATDPTNSTRQQLIRRVCTSNGTTSSKVDVVLGLNILSASATCVPAPLSPLYCKGQPETVTLTVVGKGTRAPLTSVMTASLRTGASQMTIIGPAALDTGQMGLPYPTIIMTTIGAAVPTSWSATGMPAGITIDASSGTISGIPTAPAGTYTITITAIDSLSATATKGYTIVIHAAPVASADTYNINEDLVLTVAAPGVLANDTSPGGTKSAILYSGVANGSLTLSANGSFVYTPRLHFFGVDSFRYQVTDGALSSGIVTVTINVLTLNDAPVVMVPIGQETQKNVAKIFASASNRISISDVDAGTSIVQVTLTAANGNLTLPNATGLTSSTGTGTALMTIRGTIANINASLINLTFTPNANYSGAQGLVQVQANDLGFTGTGGAMTDTEAIGINVTPLGIFTNSQDVGDFETGLGATTYTAPTYTVKGSGWDIWENNDGFQFVYRQMTGNVSLTARVTSETVLYGGAVSNPVCFKDGSNQPCISVAKAGVMFRQNLTSESAIHGFVGMTNGNGSEFVYRKTAGATTGVAGSADSFDAPYWIRLTRSGNIVTAETSPNGTTWTQRGPPQTVVIGSPMYVGLATSAVYQLDTASNQHVKVNTATFDNVKIASPPSAVADAYAVNEDTTLTVPAATGVLVNDSDGEGDALTAVLVAGTPGLTLSPDGSFTYVPVANFNGTVSFTYMANDSALNSLPVTATIVVNSVNETPSFIKGADQTLGSNLGTQDIAGWATAISQGATETGQLVDFIVTNTNNALFSGQPAVSATGTLTFASAPDASGLATVSVSIHDNGGTSYGALDTSAVQTFTIIVDDAPTVTSSTGSAAYVENGVAVADPGITVADSDGLTLTSATVTMTTGYVNSQDALVFVNQSGITGTWTPATGVLALSGATTIANYQTALRSVTYSNSSNSPSTATRTVAFVVNDGFLNSLAANRTITVAATNDAPVVTATATSMAYTENGTTAVDTGVTVTDVDSTNVASATVTMTTAYVNGQDTLAFVTQNGITGTWTAATGTLALTGSATLANYQTALRSITYNNNSNNPNTATRTVTFLVSDGLLPSNTASRTITVAATNDAPVVTATATSMAYTENGTTALDTGITIADVDSANMLSATVTMTTAYVNGQDTLAFVTQNGIAGVWTASTGTLVLSGTTTIANYQTALRSITYTNSSHAPSITTRTVTFVVNDGLNSNTASRTIALTAVNDAPTITATVAAMAYTENGTTLLDPGVTPADPDSANLSSATVTMTTAYVNGQDTLAFVNQNGITGTWTASTGTLDLAGSSSVANYQTAMRSITYNNNSHVPTTTTRTVTFEVNDGLLDSNITSRTITLTAVNDAPINSVPGGQTTGRNTAEVFSSGNGNLVSISDIDAGTSTVQVQLVGTSGTVSLSSITGLTFTVGDGVSDATMTFTGTIANVNLRLAGLSFIPTTSFNGTANLQIVTSDLGNTGTGGALTDTDSVAIVVDATPVVTATVATLGYTENATPLLDSLITVTDADGGNLTSATVTMTTAYVNGQDTLAFVTQNGITGTWTASTGVMALSGSATVANYQIALRSITYNNNSNAPDTTIRTVTFVVNDGLLNSNTASRTITLTAVNDAPVVTATVASMAYTENGTTVLDPGITVTDADSANMSSVTVDMTTNFQTAQDTLAFVNQNGITGAYTASTGVMVLSGSASVANYQAALRAITYNNNSNAPSTALRTVTFVANDGVAISTLVSRTITVTAVNDAPVNSVPASAPSMVRNTIRTFSSGNGNLISTSDVDASTNVIQVQLISTLGTVTLPITTGLTIQSGDSFTADADMTFTGTIVNINLRLNGLRFNAANVAGSANLRIITSDLGFTGGGTLTDTDNIAITLT